MHGNTVDAATGSVYNFSSDQQFFADGNGARWQNTRAPSAVRPAREPRMPAQHAATGAFTQRAITVGDNTLHVVEGGQGPCVLLLPGWPQSSYCFRKIMPALAGRFRVLAIDPPGLGESGAPSGGYDTASVARLLVDALDALAVPQALLVGFDVGAWIGYALAARFPARFPRVALIDAAIPGLTPPEAYRLAPATFSGSWHFTFNFVPELPELLIEGRERAFLEWFFRSKSLHPERAFTPADIDVYAALYARRGRWGAGLGYYRALFQSIEQNLATASTPLPMPVLAVGGAAALGARMGELLRPVAPDLVSVTVPDCGHYVPEENPGGLLDALVPFLADARH